MRQQQLTAIRAAVVRLCLDKEEEDFIMVVIMKVLSKHREKGILLKMCTAAGCRALLFLFSGIASSSTRSRILGGKERETRANDPP